MDPLDLKFISDKRPLFSCQPDKIIFLGGTGLFAVPTTGLEKYNHKLLEITD